MKIYERMRFLKNLTFNRQITIGIICMFLGFIISGVTDVKWFSNIGACLFGLFFVLNPVEPENYKGYSNLKIWIRMTGILIMVLGAITHFNW